MSRFLKKHMSISSFYAASPSHVLESKEKKEAVQIRLNGP
jgi:hypothetical protein